MYSHKKTDRLCHLILRNLLSLEKMSLEDSAKVYTVFLAIFEIGIHIDIQAIFFVLIRLFDIFLQKIYVMIQQLFLLVNLNITF